MVLTLETLNASGVADDPVLLPINELADKFAILLKETAPEAIVATAELGPVAVTSPVKSVI